MVNWNDVTGNFLRGMSIAQGFDNMLERRDEKRFGSAMQDLMADNYDGLVKQANEYKVLGDAQIAGITPNEDGSIRVDIVRPGAEDPEPLVFNNKGHLGMTMLNAFSPKKAAAFAEWQAKAQVVRDMQKEDDPGDPGDWMKASGGGRQAVPPPQASQQGPSQGIKIPAAPPSLDMGTAIPGVSAAPEASRIALKNESGGDPYAVSRFGAGIVQVSPEQWGNFAAYARGQGLAVPEAFPRSREELASIPAEALSKAQLDWTTKSNVAPLVSAAKQAYPQVDWDNQGAQAMLFSLANQHGAGNGKAVIDNALKGVGQDTPVPVQDLIAAVQDERGRLRPDGTPAHFTRFPELAGSLQKRFGSEKEQFIQLADSGRAVSDAGSGYGRPQAQPQPETLPAAASGVTRGPAAVPVLNRPDAPDFSGMYQAGLDAINSSNRTPRAKKAAEQQLRAFIANEKNNYTAQVQGVDKENTERHKTNMELYKVGQANRQLDLDAKRDARDQRDFDARQAKGQQEFTDKVLGDSYRDIDRMTRMGDFEKGGLDDIGGERQREYGGRNEAKNSAMRAVVEDLYGRGVLVKENKQKILAGLSSSFDKWHKENGTGMEPSEAAARFMEEGGAARFIYSYVGKSGKGVIPAGLLNEDEASMFPDIAKDYIPRGFAEKMAAKQPGGQGEGAVTSQKDPEEINAAYVAALDGRRERNAALDARGNAVSQNPLSRSGGAPATTMVRPPSAAQLAQDVVSQTPEGQAQAAQAARAAQAPGLGERIMAAPRAVGQAMARGLTKIMPEPVPGAQAESEEKQGRLQAVQSYVDEYHRLPNDPKVRAAYLEKLRARGIEIGDLLMQTPWEVSIPQ